MNLKIEIIGLPASGKTFFYNHLKKKLNSQKKNYIRTINLRNSFIKQYLKTKTTKSLLKKYAYKIYIKNFKIKSKFLFNKEYEDLNMFIKDNFKKNKNYNKILLLYKKYINSSDYSAERKSRMLKNFEVDLIGFKFLDNNFNFSVFDEGFFQKIFFKFEYKNNFKFSLNKQIKYLKLVPKPDLIFFFDTNIKTCLERSKKRKDGFLYDNNFIKKSKNDYFYKSIIGFSKLKKITIIKLNGNSSLSKNYKIFLRTIKNYKNKK